MRCDAATGAAKQRLTTSQLGRALHFGRRLVRLAGTYRPQRRTNRQQDDAMFVALFANNATFDAEYAEASTRARAKVPPKELTKAQFTMSKKSELKKTMRFARLVEAYPKLEKLGASWRDIYSTLSQLESQESALRPLMQAWK